MLAARVTERESQVVLGLDPDPGALSGIAVTAVDNSHGKWQFSTDSGAHWTDFGAPTDADADNTTLEYVCPSKKGA